VGLGQGVIESNHIFLNRLGDAITRHGIHWMLRNHVRAAAASHPSLLRRPISPHTIRHTTATHLLRSGVDINTIRAWLGHVSIDTTNIYAEVDLQRKAEVLAHSHSFNTTASQLRVILRALVNVDPYTFADDLAADISEDPDNDKRSAEEVLLAAIDATADDKLTNFVTRLVLAGHRGIPHETELDFLTEAETAFLQPKPKKSATTKKTKPALVKPAKAAAKKSKRKKGMAQDKENAVAA
jgi:hypothetical protein